MKINNKFTKIFFIFLFFIFIFLFFNINECFSYDINYTESIEQEIISRSFKPLMYVVNNNEVFVACASDTHPYGRASDYDNYNIYHKIHASYWGDDLNGTPAFLELVNNDFGIYGYCQIFLFRDGSYVSNHRSDYTPSFLSLKDSFVYLGEVRPIFYVKDNGIMVERDFFPFTPPIPETPTQNYTLYLKDYNLMKQFKFEFKVPLIKEDTKVFCFLEDYTRNSYDSVTGTFKFYTVSTPEGYDYTDYKNYMYYDAEDKKLYLPAGCIIERYSCTATNGDLFDLTLEASYTSMRDAKFLYHNVKNTLALNEIIRNTFTGWHYGDFNEDTLISTSVVLNDFDCSEFLSAFGKAVCEVPVIR